MNYRKRHMVDRKRMNYQRKRCVGSQRGCSSCKHFLLQKVREHLAYRHRWINANVLITVEAKVASEKGGLQEYNKVASGLYKKLSEEEKRELHEQKSKEPVRRMSKQEVRATGRKVFKKIQKLVSLLLFNTTVCTDMRVFAPPAVTRA